MSSFNTDITAELTPLFDSAKSFYNKATVTTLSEGVRLLHSYDTLVVTINLNDYTVILEKDWNHSRTTVRHVREFLKQHGLSAGSQSEIEKLYTVL